MRVGKIDMICRVYVERVSARECYKRYGLMVVGTREMNKKIESKQPNVN